MSDIVEKVAAVWDRKALEAELAQASAKMVEQAAEIERLRAALRRIDRMEVYEADAHVVLWGKIGIMRDIARAALEDRT